MSHNDHSLCSTPQSLATVYSQLTPSPGMWLAKSHSCPAHSFHRTSWIQRRLTNCFFIKRNFPQDTCQLPCKLIWQRQTHNPRLAHTQKMAGIQTLPCSPLALLPSGRSWPSLQRHAPALTVKGCLYFQRDVQPQKVKKHIFQVSEMDQWAEALAYRPTNLSSIPGSYEVAGECWPRTSDLHIYLPLPLKIHK